MLTSVQLPLTHILDWKTATVNSADTFIQARQFLSAMVDRQLLPNQRFVIPTAVHPSVRMTAQVQRRQWPPSQEPCVAGDDLVHSEHTDDGEADGTGQ